MNQINNAPDFVKLVDEVMDVLTPTVAKMALAFFEDSFDKEGFTDHSFIPWPKRKDDEEHSVLWKSGTLRDSLHIVQAANDRVEIGIDESLPYAEIHNAGGTITVPVTDKFRKFCWAIFLQMSRGSAYASGLPEEILKWKYMALTKKSHLTIRIPQRKYIGESAVLDKMIDETAVKIITKAFKNIDNAGNN